MDLSDFLRQKNWKVIVEAQNPNRSRIQVDRAWLIENGVRPFQGIMQDGAQSHRKPSAQSLSGVDETEDIATDHELNVNEDIWEDDPLEADIGEGITFKRKKPSKPFTQVLNDFLPSRHSVTEPQSASSRSIHVRDRRFRERINDGAGDEIALGNRHASQGIYIDAGKEDISSDWYQEGLGRRAGYDDLTAIDWIFEYTKERQRLRILRSQALGFLGSLQQLIDASHVWLILIGTGMLAGLLAAGINVASDWLGDLKVGFCRTGVDGGYFWLNRGFCCWGHEEQSHCQGWTPWSRALHIRAGAGAYIVEYLLYILLSAFFAACAAVLVRNYAKYAKHSGIPEIKTVLGGFVMRRFMGLWTLTVKSLGLCLAVASGLWLGKEGPLVHVACCCANLFMKLFPTINTNEARKREVLSAAAASGISVAFGSPIGGVLFSLEQLSYYFPDKTMWQSFVCAMVASVTLQAFNPYRTGKLVLYQVKYTTGWHGFEMVPYALLGVIGGIYGGLFIKANMWVARWRKQSQWSQNPIIEVLVVAIGTAIINYPNKFMRAQSSELVYMLFAECAAVTEDQFGICKTGTASAGVIILLLEAALLGFLLASITFGLQVPAGIILPSMAIGALYGRAVGIMAEVWQNNHPTALIFTACEPDVPCVTPGTYAIIGAASALGGVTRMTVSIVVIMFELTGALTYVLPIMIAVMISKWVGDAFGKKGIYETWIHFNEYPFLDNKEDYTVVDIPVTEVMTQAKDMTVIPAQGHTLQTLNELLLAQPFRGFPVVSDDDDRLLLGYISRTELAFALNSPTVRHRKLPPSTKVLFMYQPSVDPQTTLDLRPWMDQTPITLSSKSSLDLTVSMFQKLGLRYVLFCDKGRLMGFLTKKDLWYILDSAAYTQSGNDPIGYDGDRRDEDRGLLSNSSMYDDPNSPHDTR